jgi:two-component system chemotaxis sensor kinase CheA
MKNLCEQWSAEEFNELRKVFFSQAYEIADELQDAMLRLEADPGDEETLRTVKRHVHTLKGDSHAIGLDSIGTLCHRMEDVLSSLMDDGHAGPEATDLLLGCVDAVRRLLAAGESGAGDEDAGDAMEKIGRFLARRGAPGAGEARRPAQDRATEYEELQIQAGRRSGLSLFEVEAVFHPLCGEKAVAALLVAQKLGSKGEIIRSTPALESPGLAAGDRVTFMLSTGLNQGEIEREAMIAGIIIEAHVKSCDGAGRQQAKAAPQSLPATAGARGELLRVEASKVDRVMDLVGELIIGRSMIDQVTREIQNGAAAGDVAARLFAVNSYLDRTVSDIQKDVMKMRMVPVYHVFRKFPKMVRDLSAEKGKRVRLEMKGSETELDKGIVDALGEPLAHIVRNMIDHGIEGPEERRRSGKPEEGVITLRAYHEASQIVIETRDDGRGIDIDKLKRKAVEKGLIGPEDAARMSDGDAVDLVFLPGLSTAENVTETSGRGIGMDAVKNAVEAMKGSVEIESWPGAGALIRLRLPLTLAVIRALLFEVGSRLYAVPVASIAEVAKIAVDELASVDGRRTLLLREQVISLISLEDLFRINGNGRQKKFALIMGAGGRKAGLMIDRLLWQQELVIKAVDSSHTQSDLVAGASILGDGKVVLILDVLALFRKAVNEEKKRLVAV